MAQLFPNELAYCGILNLFNPIFLPNVNMQSKNASNSENDTVISPFKSYE